jgi:ABC-type Fe3+/spermidine/putrescine transport system ATPase subunit
MSLFQKAQKQQKKLKIALMGPSGSGKTFSSLRLAAGLTKATNGKIAVIDTENFSSSLYAKKFNFDVAAMSPPYTVEKYLKAMEDAKDYEVLIIDSITHAWAGEGGLLAKKESMDSRGGNSYTNWANVTKEHEQFKAKLLNFSGHLIVTMRSKMEYVLSTNEKGKQAPVKVGLAPIQRDGMEYEFDIVFDVGMNHETVVSKERFDLFKDQIFTITEATGEALINWQKE